MKFTKIANELIELLKKEGINAYIWHTATTGSVYVRFEDPRIGSVRIGNHDGREKYQYKFNIRADKKGEGFWTKSQNIWRYYQPLHSWHKIIPVIVKRQKDVTERGTPAMYQYGIPSYKKRQNQ